MSTPSNHSDPWLDAQLRSVPLPADLLARLHRVAAPHGVAGEEVADAEWADSDLDQLLRDVAVPQALFDRLQRIPRREPRPVLPVGRLAFVAMVLVAMGVGFLALTGALPYLGVRISRELAENERGSAMGPKPSTELAASVAPDQSRAGGAPAMPSAARTSVAVPEDPAVDADLRETDLVDLVARGPTGPEHAVEGDSLVDLEPAAATDESDLGLALADSGSPAIDGPRMVFGAPERGHDRLPPLEFVTPGLARGVKPPRLPGYDLAEQLRTGFHPFVSPDAHGDLQVSIPPLSVAAQNFDLVCRVVAAGRLPSRDQVRTEEFLAAMEYRFPPAQPGSLGLRTAAGPSPFGAPGTRLLQLGVVAGPLPIAGRAPAAMTVVVDVPKSMTADGRLDRIRGSLRAFVRLLGPHDTCRLIALGDSGPMVVEASGERRDELLDSIEQLSGRRTGDFGNAVEAVFGAGGIGAGRRCIFISAGASRLSSERFAGVTHRLAAARGQGFALSMVDLADDAEPMNDGRQAGEKLAAAIGEPVVQNDDPAAMLDLLVRGLSSSRSKVAESVSLKLLLNPKAVDSYRLVGHEALTLTGPNSAPLEINLQLGETVTALYELRLKPTGGDDVATVELSWRDPANPKAEPQHASQRISRLQFAKSFSESPLSLQVAALAARAAECLRQPASLTAGRTLQPVISLAQNAASDIRQDVEFQRLLKMAQRADRLAAQRRAAP